MIGWLVPLAVFNTVVLMINQELGSIPRRSRKVLILLLKEKNEQKTQISSKKTQKK